MDDFEQDFAEKNQSFNQLWDIINAPVCIGIHVQSKQTSNTLKYWILNLSILWVSINFTTEAILTFLFSTLNKPITTLKSNQNNRDSDTGHAPPPPHPLMRSKKKKGNLGKKERFSKQKLLKGCHQGQNVTVLAILECLKFKNCSCRPTTVAGNAFQCSMAPPLWNPFRRPWISSLGVFNGKFSLNQDDIQSFHH